MRSLGIAGFVVSFGIILFVLHSVGIGELLRIYSEINFYYWSLAVFVYVLIILLSAIRWDEFIIDMGMKAKFASVFAISWIGCAINSVTPIAISGGEPAKAYFLSKVSGAKKSRTFATVIATDFLEFGSFVLLDIIAVMIIYFKLDLPVIILYPLLFTIGIGILAIGSLVYTSLNRKASLAVTLFFTSILKKVGIFKKYILKFEENLSHNIDVFNSALREVSFRTIVSTMGISVLARVLDVLRLYLIIIALGGSIDPSFIVIAIALGTVASLVPFLPGSIGAVEPAMIAGFMLGGLGFPLATAVVIVDRIIVLGLNTSIGFGCMYFLLSIKSDQTIKKLRIPQFLSISYDFLLSIKSDQTIKKLRIPQFLSISYDLFGHGKEDEYGI